MDGGRRGRERGGGGGDRGNKWEGKGCSEDKSVAMMEVGIKSNSNILGSSEKRPSQLATQYSD
jgi:hypothetical protein